KNPKIDSTLKSLIFDEMPEMQADFIDILTYRQSINLTIWQKLLDTAEAPVIERITRSYVENNIQFDNSLVNGLIEEVENPIYEEGLFTGILLGRNNLLIKSRSTFHQSLDKIKNLPLYFSCACRFEDYPLLKLSLEEEKARLSAVKALGMMGLGDSIPLLIRNFSNDIKSKKEWDIQKSIAESLELITGANLEMPMPDVVEGPEGKEHEVKIATGWNEIWAKWWMNNNTEFQDYIRYRRGKPFYLGSCIEEMEYSRGNYWSRQHAYYELQARSGEHIAPFFADWYVKDQNDAIRQWKQWWEENSHKYGSSQWLYAGKEI
ncbi:MAG: hypothetical protein MJE63_02170, partial [Proteobacteria bacterium]|nr:hypothetical protein [Pseudomonadota bacterium]